MPLTGTSVREWVAMTDPAHIKYDHLRHRRRRKSHQRLPPSWLQTMLSQILLTVFHVRVRLMIVYVRVLLAVLRARVFLMLLWARAHWKVSECSVCTYFLTVLSPLRLVVKQLLFI